MASVELVSVLKQIVAHGKSGNVDEAYKGYRDLFSGPVFAGYEPGDQRQALKLMVYAKATPGAPPPAKSDAHRAAIGPLTDLVSRFGEPSDHEMLGMCHVVLGNEDSASAIFKAGLAIERERNPGSDLCGALMKRVSAL